MKKLLFVLALGIVCVGSSQAAGAARGAKGMTAVNYTTTASSVSVAGPVALYSVILSSGAASEYVALFDASATGALTSASTGSSFRTRVFYNSASSNTIVNFDPPLQFNNGLVTAGSAATGAVLFVYEKGRIVQGY